MIARGFLDPIGRPWEVGGAPFKFPVPADWFSAIGEGEVYVYGQYWCVVCIQLVESIFIVRAAWEKRDAVDGVGTEGRESGTGSDCLSGVGD